VWESRCSNVADEIEAQIQGIRSAAARRKAREVRKQEVVDHAVLNADGSGDVNAGSGGGGAGAGAGGNMGAGRATRSGVIRGGLSEENRKGKGIGNKRDLDEQQEDEDVPGWGQRGGGDEDGGVGAGLAKMEVDEGDGMAGKSVDGGRTAKRAAGKKGI
jgi:hypothetical protein